MGVMVWQDQKGLFLFMTYFLAWLLARNFYLLIADLN